MALNLPANPSLGRVFPGTNGVEYIWDGTKWSYVSDGSGPGGGASVSVGENPPLFPGVGDLWFDIVNGLLYVWYSDETQNPSSGEGQWVDARPSEFAV
jgi:hypothetical protein